MTIVPVTGVGTWVWYTKCIIYMLQLWLHCAGSSCTIALYGIGTIIPDCDCQHGILYYCIYSLRLFFCRYVSFLLSSIFFHFCWFNFSVLFFAWVVHSEFDWRIWNFLTVCSQFLYGSSTWNLHWELVSSTGNPYIWVL